MSDFDDIFILFMKMELDSCLRLGSKQQQQKLFCRPFSSCISYKIQTLLKFYSFLLLIMDMESAKSDVSSWKKKSVETLFVLKLLRVSIINFFVC